MIRYLPSLIWIAILSYVTHRHLKLFRIYHRQYRVVRNAELAGAVETGSSFVAYNQRARYVVRVTIAALGLAIGLAGAYGIHNPSFGSSVGFGIIVLSYFYLSETATGYLSIRDQRVLDHILELDAAKTAKCEEDAATP